MTKIRKRVCSIVYKPTETIQNENVALFEQLKKTFELISQVMEETGTDKDTQPAADIFRFILKLSCDQVNEKYKHLAFYNARIFNFDKPNKYKEEVKIMRCLHELSDIIPFKKSFSLSVDFY